MLHRHFSFRPFARFFSSPATSAAVVNELRKMTGASIGLCREALVTESNDLTKAYEWLRKKGIDTSKKREDRKTSSGMISYALNPSSDVVLCEVNCETDFVARNKSFLDFVKETANQLGETPSTQYGLLSSLPSTVESSLTQFSSVVGEKLHMPHAYVFPNDNEKHFTSLYFHGESAPNCSDKCSLLCIELDKSLKEEEKELLQKVMKSICMQIVASSPLFFDSLSTEFLESEKRIIEEQAKQKIDTQNAKAYDKYLQGKIKQLITNHTFLHQEYLMSEKLKQQGVDMGDCKTVNDVLIKTARMLDMAPPKILSVCNFQVGFSNSNKLLKYIALH